MSMLDQVRKQAQAQKRASDVEPAGDACDGAEADDLRADRRINTLLKGVLKVEGCPTGIDCLVRDLSDGGAKIDVDPNHQIAPTFTLEVPELNTAFHAELRWRYAQTAGVKFIARRRLSNDEESPTRAELIAENAQLRETIQGLTERLTQLGERVVDGSVLRGRVPQRVKRGGADSDTPARQKAKSGRARRGEGTNRLGSSGEG